MGFELMTTVPVVATVAVGDRVGITVVTTVVGAGVVSVVAGVVGSTN
jgi:hypothetical protein